MDANLCYHTVRCSASLASVDACCQLEHLDLSGCRLITDVGLERIGACFKSELSESYYDQVGSCCSSCGSCPKKSDPILLNETIPPDCDSFSPGLSYLNLSGCTSVSDYGIQSLLEVSLQMESLTFMDLSGCSRISGMMLNSIAASSSRLHPQDLYYCNMIQEGPYPAEANGCQNLECPLRGCCCFDQ